LAAQAHRLCGQLVRTQPRLRVVHGAGHDQLVGARVQQEVFQAFPHAFQVAHDRHRQHALNLRTLLP
jgi:hypothetical protein